MRRITIGRQRMHSDRLTTSRVGRTLTVASAIAVCVFGLCNGTGTAQAASISVEASSNCSGPDAWVASWYVSISSDSPGETWRLDSSAGAGDPRPVTEPIVLEQVQSLDEPIAHLDAVATLIESGSTVSTASTVERPTACAAAPAPTNAVAENPPTIDEPAEVAAGVTIESTEADPAASSALAAPPAVTVPAVVQAPASTDVVKGTLERGELPQTGSTSGMLVALAFACITAGVVLLRIGTSPPAPS